MEKKGSGSEFRVLPDRSSEIFILYKRGLGTWGEVRIFFDLPPKFVMSLDAQRFFLTYSQVINPDVNEHTLTTFFHGKNHFDWSEVNHELHDDGGSHFHAVVAFTRRFRGLLSAFDYLGVHPNIKSVKSGRRDLQRCRHYIRKDGVERLVAGGTPPELGDPDDTKATERERWSDALTCANQSDFMEYIKSAFPKEYILKYHDIDAFSRHHFNQPSEYEPQFPRDSFTVPAEADEWVASVLGEVCSGSLTRTSLIY